MEEEKRKAEEEARLAAEAKKKKPAAAAAKPGAGKGKSPRPEVAAPPPLPELSAREKIDVARQGYKVCASLFFLSVCVHVAYVCIVSVLVFPVCHSLTLCDWYFCLGGGRGGWAPGRANLPSFDLSLLLATEPTGRTDVAGGVPAVGELVVVRVRSVHCRRHRRSCAQDCGRCPQGCWLTRAVSVLWKDTELHRRGRV